MCVCVCVSVLLPACVRARISMCEFMCLFCFCSGLRVFVATHTLTGARRWQERSNKTVTSRASVGKSLNQATRNTRGPNSGATSQNSSANDLHLVDTEHRKDGVETRAGRTRSSRRRNNQEVNAKKPRKQSAKNQNSKKPGARATTLRGPPTPRTRAPLGRCCGRWSGVCAQSGVEVAAAPLFAKTKNQRKTKKHTS